MKFQHFLLSRPFKTETKITRFWKCKYFIGMLIYTCHESLNIFYCQDVLRLRLRYQCFENVNIYFWHVDECLSGLFTQLLRYVVWNLTKTKMLIFRKCLYFLDNLIYDCQDFLLNSWDMFRPRFDRGQDVDILKMSIINWHVDIRFSRLSWHVENNGSQVGLLALVSNVETKSWLLRISRDKRILTNQIFFIFSKYWLIGLGIVSVLVSTCLICGDQVLTSVNQHDKKILTFSKYWFIGLGKVSVLVLTCLICGELHAYLVFTFLIFFFFSFFLFLYSFLLHSSFSYFGPLFFCLLREWNR